MKNLNVARMGSNDSKYGQRRAEFDRGDRVVCGEYRGVVARATAREVVIVSDSDGLKYSFNARYVEAE